MEGSEYHPALSEEEVIISAYHNRRGIIRIGEIIFAGAILSAVQVLRAQSPIRESSSAEATQSQRSPDFWSNRGRWTFGAQLGFALENDIGHNISHISILIAQPNVGFILRNFHIPGFPVSRFSVVSEGIVGGAVHPGGRLIGHAVLFRLDGKPIHRFVPFFNFGAGVMNTTLSDRAPELSGHTQFNPQGGPGIQYFFNPQRALVLEYRYLHVSNNGIQGPNLGFNGSMITLGFRWLRRPARLGGRAPQHSGSLIKLFFGKD